MAGLNIFYSIQYLNMLALQHLKRFRKPPVSFHKYTASGK